MLTNAGSMAFAVALCSGGRAFEYGNQFAAPLSGFDWLLRVVDAPLSASALLCGVLCERVLRCTAVAGVDIIC